MRAEGERDILLRLARIEKAVDEMAFRVGVGHGHFDEEAAQGIRDILEGKDRNAAPQPPLARDPEWPLPEEC